MWDWEFRPRRRRHLRTSTTINGPRPSRRGTTHSLTLSRQNCTQTHTHRQTDRHYTLRLEWILASAAAAFAASREYTLCMKKRATAGLAFDSNERRLRKTDWVRIRFPACTFRPPNLRIRHGCRLSMQRVDGWWVAANHETRRGKAQAGTKANDVKREREREDFILSYLITNLKWESPTHVAAERPTGFFSLFFATKRSVFFDSRGHKINVAKKRDAVFLRSNNYEKTGEKWGGNLACNLKPPIKCTFRPRV